MINWNKGLRPEQELLLEQLLEQESLIQPSYHKFISDNYPDLTIFGRLLPRNKLIKERDSGYTYYVEAEGILHRFSAFKYKLI